MITVLVTADYDSLISKLLLYILLLREHRVRKIDN